MPTMLRDFHSPGFHFSLHFVNITTGDLHAKFMANGVPRRNKACWRRDTVHRGNQAGIKSAPRFFKRFAQGSSRTGAEGSPDRSGGVGGARHVSTFAGCTFYAGTVRRIESPYEFATRSAATEPTVFNVGARR